MLMDVVQQRRTECQKVYRGERKNNSEQTSKCHTGIQNWSITSAASRQKEKLSGFVSLRLNHGKYGRTNSTYCVAVCIETMGQGQTQQIDESIVTLHLFEDGVNQNATLGVVTGQQVSKGGTPPFPFPLAVKELVQ